MLLTPGNLAPRREINCSRRDARALSASRRFSFAVLTERVNGEAYEEEYQAGGRGGQSPAGRDQDGDRHRGAGRHSRRRLPAQPPLPHRGRPRHRQDDARAAIPARRRARAASRASTSRSPRRRRSCEAVAAVARLVARRRSASSSWCRSEDEPRRRSRSTPSSTRPRSSSARRRSAVLDEVERIKPAPRRLRLALGDAAAGARPAALPPPDPRAQAVLRRAAAAPCCCSTTRPPTGRRPAAADDRARRHRAGAAGASSTGAERRRLRVVKLRGARFRGGYHDFNIETGGIARLPAPRRRRAPPRRRDRQVVTSGVPRARRAARRRARPRHEHAGHRPGRAAASRRSPRSSPLPPPARGEHAAIFIFDESLETLLARADGSAWTSAAHVDDGLHRPSSRSTRRRCRRASSRSRCATPSSDDGARVVVIDSLNGYLNAMPEERFLRSRCTSC